MKIATLNISESTPEAEERCQRMLWIGYEHMTRRYSDFKKHRDKFIEKKNGKERIITESKHYEKLEYVLLIADPNPSVAEFSVVVSNLFYILNHGYVKWIEDCMKAGRKKYDYITAMEFDIK